MIMLDSVFKNQLLIWHYLGVSYFSYYSSCW